MSDLNEKKWYDFNSRDLANGQVASWIDGLGGVDAAQGTSENQPTMTRSEGGVVFGDGHFLEAPYEQNFGWTRRGLIMVFRVDLEAAGNNGGSLFAFNGYSGSIANRCPYVGYDKTVGGGSLVCSWSGSSSLETSIYLPLSGDASSWHSLVMRRVGGRCYASLDGATEQVADTLDFVPRYYNGSNPVRFGDYQEDAAGLVLKRLIITQSELTSDEVDRIHGWAKWLTGSVSDLPSDHPYKSVFPKSDPYVQPTAFNDAEDWVEIEAYWDSEDIGQQLEQNYGEPIAAVISGMSEVFRDDFTSLDIGEEWDSPEDHVWFAPVHRAANGSAIGQGPNASPSVYSQDGSLLTITMQFSDPNWYSGVITSVNSDGRGLTWNPGETPTYFEASMAFSAGNNVASWPAFWIKAAQEFRERTTIRTEIDVIEGYNSDPDGHHCAYHNWPPDRDYGGRLSEHELVSNYLGLGAGGQWPLKPQDLFDGEQHIYGCYIDSEWIIFSFDGLEVGRSPTRPDMLRDMYILVDLALFPDESGSASGEYTLDVDYIRVLQ